jgi:hypothetical protein
MALRKVLLEVALVVLVLLQGWVEVQLQLVVGLKTKALQAP